jgi:hypothetical protein
LFPFWFLNQKTILEQQFIIDKDYNFFAHAVEWAKNVNEGYVFKSLSSINFRYKKITLIHSKKWFIPFYISKTNLFFIFYNKSSIIN